MATRTEAVRLTFIDDSTSGVMRAAAAFALLDKSIDGVDGNSIAASRSTQGLARDNDRLSQSAVRATSSIDQYSGRLGLLARAAGALGPALIPVGAVAIPAVAGLANQFGFAAVAAGTAVLAFQGVGDTLKAVNKAALEPTAANMQAARDAMASLTPAGRDLVTTLQELKPLYLALRDTGQEAMFPGLIRGFEELERLGPEVNAIVAEVGDVLGDLFADGAESLAGDRFADFFEMLASEARPTLTAMGHALGDFVHGLSELWEAFAPLNQSFGSWLADVAAGFDRWATSLEGTKGFEEFLAYIDEMGPQVAEATAAIANALIQIVQAAAPIAGPVLQSLTALADAIAAIADSPIGTPIFAAVAAMSALSLASSAATASVARLQAGMSTLAANPIVFALAGIAAGATNAATQFDRWQDGTQDLGNSLLRVVPGVRDLALASDYLGLSLPGLEKPMSNIAKLGPSFTAGFTDSRVAMTKLANGASLSAAEIRGLTDAMLENRAAAIRAFDAVTQYRHALKDARAQAERNNAGIRGNSKAALENRNALSQLASAWLNQSAAVRNNTARQQEARRAFIQTAVAMGVPIQRARELASSLLAIPRSRVVDVHQRGAEEATRQVNGLVASLNSVRSKTAYITTVFTERHNIDIGQGSTSNNVGADGTTVPKTGLPYADRHLYLLADGERVTSNRYGQVDKSRKALDLINSGRLNDRILGLADGGLAGGIYTSGSTSGLGGGTYGELSGGLSALGSEAMKAVTRLEKLNAALLREERQLRMMEKAYQRQEKAIDKQRQKTEEAARAVEDMKQQMQSFGDNISGRLTTELFANGSDFGAVSGILQGNAAAGSSWIQSLTTLLGAGLDGPALQALLEQATAEQLAGVAGWTPEQIAQFEQMFGNATSLTQGAGMLSAQAVMGQQMALTQAQWAEEKAELAAANQQRREMLREIREQKQEIKVLNRRVERLTNAAEHHDKTGPERTGKAVGDAFDKRAGDKARARS